MTRFPAFKTVCRVILAIVLTGGIVLYPHASRADMGLEIDHLFQYIETSDCTFLRNGETHDSRDAGAHIRKKYNHIKRRIKTTEDFIRYAATKSSLSGRAYRVTCDSMEMTTAEWLADELARFRENSL